MAQLHQQEREVKLKIPEPLTPQTSAPSSSGAVLTRNVGIGAVKRQDPKWYDRLNPNAFGQEGRALAQTGQMITEWGEKRRQENQNLLNLKQYSQSIEKGTKDQEAVKQLINQMGEINIDPVTNEQKFNPIPPQNLMDEVDKRLSDIDLEMDKAVDDPVTRERAKFQIMQRGLSLKAKAQVQAFKVMKQQTMDSAVNSAREQLNVLSQKPVQTWTEPVRIQIESMIADLPQKSNGMINTEEAKEEIIKLRKEFAANRISNLSRLEDGIEIAEHWLEQTDLIDDEEKNAWYDHLDKMRERRERDDNRINLENEKKEKKLEDSNAFEAYKRLLKRTLPDSELPLTSEQLELESHLFSGHIGMYNKLLDSIGKEDHETDPEYYADLSLKLGNSETRKTITRGDIWRSTQLSIEDKDHFDGILKNIENGTLIMDTFAWKQATKLMGVSFGFPTDRILDVGEKQRRAAAWKEFYRRVNKEEAPDVVANDLIRTQSQIYDDPTSDAVRFAVKERIKEIPPALHQTMQIGNRSYPDTVGMKTKLKEALRNKKILPEKAGKIKEALDQIDGYIPLDWIGSQRAKLKMRSIVSPSIWAIGLLYTLHSHFNGCPHAVILGGWLIGPPLWFWLEYQFLFDRTVDDWKLFQHSQLLQRNLWLGVAAFLAAKYLPLS